MPETTTEKRLLPFADVLVEGNCLRLHPARVAEWREEKTLFLAAAHLGKIAHFRRSGFNLPASAGADTFARLSEVMLQFRPDRLVFLGDLFHSDFNEDFLRFAAWRRNFSACDVWLIPGNHDLAGGPHLSSLGLDVRPAQSLGPFFLQHEPVVDFPGFLLCGHLHPSVSLAGKGRHQVRVPAFWQGNRSLCLPSFGTFTGAASIKAGPGDLFYALSPQGLFRISASILS